MQKINFSPQTTSLYEKKLDLGDTLLLGAGDDGH